MDQQNHKACTRFSPQLMVENMGKWRERPHWFLRTTNKMAPLEPPNIEKENTNHFFFYCFLSLIPSILFCFVSSIMRVDLYTSFRKCRCFWIEKWGSTYTWIDLYTRKYSTCALLIFHWPGVQLCDDALMSALHVLWSHILLPYTDTQTLHYEIHGVGVSQMLSCN